MLRVSVGKSRKLSQDYNSHGFSVSVDGEINARLDDPERVLAQVQELFDVADEALKEQIEKHIDKSSATPAKPRSGGQETSHQPRWPSRNGVDSKPNTASPATNKQVQFLLNLGRQKGLSKVELESHVSSSLNFDTPKSVYELSKSEAASAIDQLVNAK